MNQVLKYSLENFDMITDGNHAEGLVSVQGFMDNDLSPDEIIALENAKRYKADYVYFRKFKNRPSVPQVYLYDFTGELGVEDEELTKLHQQLYSAGQVPMFFIFTKRDVKIFNCFDPPINEKKICYKPLTVISLAADLLGQLNQQDQEKFKAFSAKFIDNGTFWESSKYGKQFNFNKSAYERLLGELKNALGHIIKTKILPADIARKIMVTSILIKYLEEREDEKGNKVFPPDFFNQFADGATKFSEIFGTTGAYLKLLDYLAKHFNGGIFELEKEERAFIGKKDLTRFGYFLEGKLEGIQLVFWSLYSFNDLPVELISNIYEEFIGKNPGVVYTPSYLVDFLLDEAMPLTQDDTNFKVLDPACGSGVFLVGAYRRLIYRWRKKNGWKSPKLNTLKKLLRENIFGVELNKQAAELTVFSLSLALCDELTPLQIWKDLKFDDLHKENILRETDFFDAIHKEEFQNKFDLMIGNPPFVSKLTEAAQRVEATESKKRKLSVVENGKTKEVAVSLPDNQVSLLFLEQSVKLCKENGLVCLIQPSGPFLYNNSSFRFRQVLLKKYHVPQIIDFTHISRVLFGNGDVATAAVFIKKEVPNNKPLLHVTVRRTKPHKEKLYFDLDTYDFHYVPYEMALNAPFVWKCNFIGGHRFHQLLSKLRVLPNVGDFLTHKIENNGWDVGEGYIIGNRQEINELKHLKSLNQLNEPQKNRLITLEKKYKKADFITNQPTFEPKDFDTNGIKKKSIYLQKEEYFIRTRREKIYKSPHILLTRIIIDNLIPTIYLQKYLTFKDRVVGIHAPKQDEEDLKRLYKALTDKINIFLLAFTSSEFMVNRSSSFLKKDINNFVFSDSDDDFELGKFDSMLVEDFLNCLIEFRRNGEKSKIAVQDATKEDLKLFGEAFCEILATAFKSIKPHPYFETDSYICFPFYFGKKPNIDFSDSEQTEKNIAELVQKQSGISLRLTRIIRMYEGNVIYLIKPKKLRYWLRSIALRDADETFADLRKQGY